jgi:Ca2+-binding EF-hand superfamily protein
MDSNSDGQVSLAELKQKLKMLQTPLDDGEMNLLFQTIDRLGQG